MKWTIAEISGAIGAVGDMDEVRHLRPRRVVTDSRLVEPGDLFICLAGEHFDGHAFAADAAAKGALAVVAERPVSGVNAPVLMTHGTIEALGRLAAFHRSRTMARVVGVTGTAGKTTVKELLAGILSRRGRTHKNYLNLNNLIGLPMSILEADGDEDFWVLETGISVPGEMEKLAGILRPDLGIIVNIGPAHLEGLGDLAGVAREKARLLEHVLPGGRRVVSFDYPELRAAAGSSAIGFSCGDAPDARYRGKFLGPANGLDGRYLLNLQGEEVEVTLPWQGRFALESALAAAAAAHVLGLSPADIALGLESARPSRQRFQCHKTGNLLLIDDSYNANPLSMAVSLDSARELARGRPLALLLGEMRELGASAASAHEDLGRRVAESGARGLFWVGGHGDDVGRGLVLAGFAGRFQRVETVTGFLMAWREMELPDPVLLVKGSRANKLETYVGALLKECA